MADIVFEIGGLIRAHAADYVELAERVADADPTLPHLSAVRLYDLVFYQSRND